MKLQQLATLATAMGATFLTACGGGGGGGASATLAPFTSFSAAQANSTITAGGIAQSGTYSYDVLNDVITARTIAASTTGASISVRTDSNGMATALTITPANGAPIAFSSPTDTFGVLNINSDIGAVISADGTKYALLADATTIGWDFQTFGVWTTGAGTGSGTYGALSVGAETAGNAIPTSGTATYNGYTGGRYVNATGSSFFTSSAMTASADFAARNVNFATTLTTTTPDLLTSTSNSSLNMTGTLTYAPATNQITGNVTTTGGLSGTVNGRFYGPAAQEIGGTFSVSGPVSVVTAGPSLEGYAGAFGGKR